MTSNQKAAYNLRIDNLSTQQDLDDLIKDLKAEEDQDTARDFSEAALMVAGTRMLGPLASRP